MVREELSVKIQINKRRKLCNIWGYAFQREEMASAKAPPSLPEKVFPGASQPCLPSGIWYAISYQRNREPWPRDTGQHKVWEGPAIVTMEWLALLYFQMAFEKWPSVVLYFYKTFLHIL